MGVGIAWLRLGIGICAGLGATPLDTEFESPFRTQTRYQPVPPFLTPRRATRRIFFSVVRRNLSLAGDVRLPLGEASLGTVLHPVRLPIQRLISHGCPWNDASEPANCVMTQTYRKGLRASMQGLRRAGGGNSHRRPKPAICGVAKDQLLPPSASGA